MPRLLPRLLSASLMALLLASAACGKRAPRTARRPLPPPTYADAAAEPAGPVTSTPPTNTATPQLSETERKAAARAAFAEGIGMQERNDCAGALPRFETAERLFDAPTHLLHIAQCQAATGRLVEAQESYITLSHVALAPQAPEAFRQAQDAGSKELVKLKPRIPTLRVEVTPTLASFKGVVVQINGTQMPADLVGVARPLNPGRYRVTVTASPGRTGTSESDLKEGEARSLEVRLSK